MRLFLECSPVSDVVTVLVPWVRVARVQDQPGMQGVRYRVLINPAAAGGPGEYLAQLHLGGQALAVVLRICSAPTRSRATFSAPLVQPTAPSSDQSSLSQAALQQDRDQAPSWLGLLAFVFIPMVVLLLLVILLATDQSGSGPAAADSAPTAQVAPEPGGGGLEPGAPPQEQDPPVPDPPPVVEPPGRYLVIAGSFRKKGNAQVETDRVRKAGYGSATIALSDDYPCLRPGYWIVLVGIYGDFDEANRVRGDVKSRGFSVRVADTQKG